MEIIIEDIPEEGLEVSATKGDSWFLGLVKDVLGESFETSDDALLKLNIRLIEKNVNVDGELSFSTHPNCDRCLAHYQDCRSIPVNVVLAPLYERKKRGGEEEVIEADLVKEDEDFGYYEGDRFDLSEIIREKMFLSEPMKNLCKDDCKGLCQRCGEDLNLGLCGCKEETGDHRWDVLKNIKPSK